MVRGWDAAATAISASRYMAKASLGGGIAGDMMAAAPAAPSCPHIRFVRNLLRPCRPRISRMWGKNVCFRHGRADDGFPPHAVPPLRPGREVLRTDGDRLAAARQVDPAEHLRRVPPAGAEARQRAA